MTPFPHRRSGRVRRALAPVLVAMSGAALAIAGGIHVSVSLPVPPRINTLAVRKILIARFVSSDKSPLDVGREFVRVIRRELSKGTKFEILDVEPPALPEQPLEEILRNATFWKHVAEEFGADLVVSGRVAFTSADRSGFVQQDSVSPITGQNVRRTVFAEREEFGLDVNLWFFKGANGAFLYEDSFRDNQIYDGKSNDALGVFYNLTDRLTPDLLSILAPQKREESRYIFDE